MVERARDEGEVEEQDGHGGLKQWGDHELMASSCRCTVLEGFGVNGLLRS